MNEYKTSRLREMAVEELENLLAELHQEQFNLRFRNSLKQVDNPLRIREIRRAIARVETLIAENKSGVRKLGKSAV